MQTPVLGGVFKGGDHAIAGNFPFGLAVGVVGDGADHRQVLSRVAQTQIHGAQLTVHGLAEALFVALGIGSGQQLTRWVET
ncbi:hypothetical protein D9M71_835550 [compost metagenome]